MRHYGTWLYVVAVLCAVAGAAWTAEQPLTKLGFTTEGKEFRFDTGLVRGSLRPQGKSLGLTPVVDCASGTTISGAYGLVSHYRLLDAEARYGGGAWDWASTARLLPDGAVEAAWTADEGHPFDMKAVYRWTAPGTLDVTTSVTPKKDLSRLEVFLASYFVGFPASFVYVKPCPETEGKPGFLEAKKSFAVWQMFPRDDAAAKVIGDGRWKRPPNPVDWKVMPPLAGPLAMRRNAKAGMVALVMAPPDDCFAVATPHSEEGHGSLYLSLFGRDVKAGETVAARSRLVVARELSDDQAIALYQAYLKETQPK